MIHTTSNGNLIKQKAIADLGSSEDASVSALDKMSASGHFAQFYETDAFLLTSLRSYVAAGLSGEDVVIVVANRDHREKLQALLEDDGVDVVLASASGRYIALDAEQTLEQFLVEGWPDGKRFNQVIGAIVSRATEGGRRVRIFGEMVALLWAEGKQRAAIALEEHWNELQKTMPFSLFCAYPIFGFARDELCEPLSQVCASHSHVIPAESYVALAKPADRLEAIIRLQQKANLLEAEVAERRHAEEALRLVKDELEVQITDLSRLHEMSLSVTSTLDMEPVLHEVLRAGMAVQGTEMGLLSLWDTEDQNLTVAVQCGFNEDFLRAIERVPAGEGACGSAYQQRRRVIVEDIEKEPIFEGYREAARNAGFRACHSTPLITRGGTIIGVLSVHFREPHRPSDRETRLMDLYARMAVDIIENARLHSRVQAELSEREALLKREQIARAEAETANRMKDEFLATVSHELRTPLNAIIGWSHMLRAGRLDETTIVRALETIERNAKSQAQLVEDILDVSRVITGQLRLSTGPVDLASVINSSIDSVQLAAESKGIKLEVTLEPMARHTIGDAGRLQQVVWNLLSNAIKFTPTGGRVAIRLERAGTNVRIEVSDSGQGISSEVLPFIFDRFRQADGTSTRSYGGLGLGLAIVRHLIELHGGTVTAHSDGEGFGSTFSVTLPLLISEPAARGQLTGRPIPPDLVNAKASPLPSLDNVQILLVDDDPDTLQLLSVVLSECRAKVQVVHSVSEALEILSWFEPTVIVSDLAMPDEDGYSLIAKIRSSPGKATIPAVALTSYVRVEDRTRALAAGFNMFVPKPVQPIELITAISNLVEAQNII